MDVLFLYRTKKKKRYFTALAEQALPEYRCMVQAYHDLPKADAIDISDEELNEILIKAELELFSAKNESWQRFRILCRPILVAQITQLYCRLMQCLTHHSPKMIGIWNGHKWQDNVLHAVNKQFNIPIVYFENGVLPKSTTMDFSGINALNSVPRDPDFYASIQPEKASEPSTLEIKGRKYKKKRHKNVDFQRPKRYLLVPFQKDRDSQILDNSPWIKSMTQLFSVLSDALDLCGQDDLHIVFREHPSAKTKYSKLYDLAAEHPRLWFDKQSDLAEIITHAEAVVTINSTVGIESLLLGTKVITLGDAFYNLCPIVLRASSTDELARCIKSVDVFCPDQSLLQQFITYLRNDYVIPGDWKKPDEKHLLSVRQRFIEGLVERPVLDS